MSREYRAAAGTVGCPTGKSDEGASDPGQPQAQLGQAGGWTAVIPQFLVCIPSFLRMASFLIAWPSIRQNRYVQHWPRDAARTF